MGQSEFFFVSKKGQSEFIVLKLKKVSSVNYPNNKKED